MLPPFEIHQPKTAAEAASLRTRLGESAALYAGGSELLLAMKEGLGSFEHLIDVKTIAGLAGRRRAPPGAGALAAGARAPAAGGRDGAPGGESPRARGGHAGRQPLL